MVTTKCSVEQISRSTKFIDIEAPNLGIALARLVPALADCETIKPKNDNGQLMDIAHYRALMAMASLLGKTLDALEHDGIVQADSPTPHIVQALKGNIARFVEANPDCHDTLSNAQFLFAPQSNFLKELIDLRREDRTEDIEEESSFELDSWEHGAAARSGS